MGVFSINNLIFSILVNALSNYWYLIVAYLFFNIIDWITGSLKAIKLKKLSSYSGTKGLFKKIGNWVVIIIAFCFSTMFEIVGTKFLNINLTIMYSLGWFTFVMLFINENISILENLVELGIKVPPILIKSLKITEDILEDASQKIIDKENTNKENTNKEK